MRWCTAALLLVACGRSTEPVESRLFFHDDPLFDVWGAGPQVGTVLVADHLTTDGVDEIASARFDPAGDHGMYTLVDEEGDCRLFSAVAFCDPACDPVDRMCVDGACVPFPAFASIGEVIVEGLGDPRELEEQPSWNGFYEPTVYVSAERLEDGRLAEGVAVAVTAEGSDVLPGFSASVTGVDPIQSAISPGRILDLPRDDSLELSWQGPAPDARVRLVLRTGEIGHGTPPREKLVCDLPDRGSLLIPGRLVAQLPEMTLPPDSDIACVGGCGEMPSGLVRYRATRVDGAAGRIEVIAAVETLFWATH